MTERLVYPWGEFNVYIASGINFMALTSQPKRTRNKARKRGRGSARLNRAESMFTQEDTVAITTATLKSLLARALEAAEDGAGAVKIAGLRVAAAILKQKTDYEFLTGQVAKRKKGTGGAFMEVDAYLDDFWGR